MPPAPREEERRRRKKKVDQARNELPRRDSKRIRWKRISIGPEHGAATDFVAEKEAPCCNGTCIHI